MKEEIIRGMVKRLQQKYNFKGPLHFTEFSNLNSIISIGFLCSRSLCYANNIEFEDVSDGEVSHNISNRVRGCTRFYFVEKNNYDVINRLNIPVYLLFNEDIIYFDLAIYSNGDADLESTEFGMDYDFFTYDINWKIVFDKRNEFSNFGDKLNEVYKSMRQSELLIDEPVQIHNLKNIIFRCKADYKRACNLFGKNKLYTVEPEMFYHDKNYIKDYNIIYDNLYHNDVFILHFSSNMPVKNDLRHEYRLYDLNDKLLRSAKVNFFESDSTEFNVEVNNLPEFPVKFKFWFYGVLSIEEIVG